MLICMNCGKDVPQTEGKRPKLYCNEACKKAVQRKAKLIDNGTKPISGHNRTGISGQPVTDLEKCRYCGKSLPALQKPRRYPGACYGCAIEQPPPITKDNTLSSRPALEFTGQMTPSERANYKTAAELAVLSKEVGKPVFNKVSVPGDDDYDGICTQLPT